MPGAPCSQLGFKPLSKKMEGTFVESQKVPPRESWEASATKPSSALLWGSSASKTSRTQLQCVWVTHQICLAPAMLDTYRKAENGHTSSWVSDSGRAVILSPI